jgi:hypothetical protein
MKEPKLCGFCGQPVKGWAGEGEVRLCHPDFGTSCYERWTVYGERPTPHVTGKGREAKT